MARARTPAERFAVWADGRGDLEPDVVETLETLKRDYLGEGDAAVWRTGQLTALMTDVLPRKVSADDEWIGAAVPTMRAFLGWADEHGLLAAGSAPVRELSAELDAIEPGFAEGMRDASRFGLTKSIFASLDVDLESLDPNDPAQLQAVMDRFNALPEHERRSITDPALRLGGVEPDVVLPAVALPSVADLARAAREAPLMRQVVGLAEWIHPRKPATATGVLTLAGARRAIAALRLLPEPESRAARPKATEETGAEAVEELTLALGAGLEPVPGLEKIRSARDVPTLHLLYGLAADAELTEIRSSSVRPGAALDVWNAGDDEDALDVWLDVFVGVLERGVDGGRETGWRLPWDEAVQDELLGRLPVLYAGEPVSVADVVRTVVVATAGGPGRPVGFWQPADVKRLATTSLEEMLGRLVAVGAVCREGDAVTMTPLGRWGLREQLVELGAEAPVLHDPASADAGELAHFVAQMPPEESAEVTRSWLAARSLEQAAEELGTAARDGSPLTRIICVAALVNAVEDHGAAPLMRYVDDPVLGAHARSALFGQGLLPAEQAPDENQRNWLAVDALAAYLELLDEPVTARSLPPEIVALIDDTLDFTTVWTVEHPQLLDVLDGVGLGHPQGRVRKAAQKAAHKARRRRLG